MDFPEFHSSAPSGPRERTLAQDLVRATTRKDGSCSRKSRRYESQAPQRERLVYFSRCKKRTEDTKGKASRAARGPTRRFKDQREVSARPRRRAGLTTGSRPGEGAGYHVGGVRFAGCPGG